MVYRGCGCILFVLLCLYYTEQNIIAASFYFIFWAGKVDLRIRFR